MKEKITEKEDGRINNLLKGNYHKTKKNETLEE